MKEINLLRTKSKQGGLLKIKGKLGLFNVILIAVNSTIGSGIFFKADSVISYSEQSIILVIISWIIACFTILCMGFAICEISNASHGNLGISSWCKRFSSKYIYAGSKNFFIYIYVPIICFFTPIYVIKYFQDFLFDLGLVNNFGTANDWAIWSVIGFLMVSWFFFSSSVSNRMVNVQNWIITIIKFVPIFSTIIIGVCILSIGGNSQLQLLPKNSFNKTATDFFKLTPFLGVFGSLSSIIFAYGGFYSITSLRTKMKDPNKNGIAILLAVAVISIIYFTIAMVMTFSHSGEGLFSGFFEKHPSFRWILGILNLTIAIGTLGIINGAIIFGINLMNGLVDTGEIIIPCCLLNKSSKARHIFGLAYLFAIYFLIFIVLSVIGGTSYFAPEELVNNNPYDAQGCYSMIKLINFANFISTWTIIFAFVFICFAVFGALKKKSQFKPKSRFFRWSGWISLSIISVSTFFLILQPLIDIFLLWINNKYDHQKIIGNALVFMLFIMFLIVSFVPTIFERKIFINRKRFLVNLLTVTERLSAKEIKDFSAQDQFTKLRLLAEMNISDKAICSSIARYPFHWLFTDETQRIAFNFLLRENISKISAFLN